MKNWLPLAVLISGLLFATKLSAEDEGKTLFKTICTACHTVNKGTLVGPDLANVHNRRSEDWIIKFVRSSQKVINSGDPVAMALFEEFNKTVMPDPNLTDAQIRVILDYIVSESPEYIAPAEGGSEEVVAVNTPDSLLLLLESVTEADIDRGKDLFVGNIRFQNNGVTCISCHNVNYGIIAGGSLAKDLTTVASRYNDPGLKAILVNSPFPAMSQAFKNNELTDEEILYLMAFLKKADKEEAFHPPVAYGKNMFYAGLGGMAIMFGIFSGLWFNRRRKSINSSIFIRQIKSS